MSAPPRSELAAAAAALLRLGEERPSPTMNLLQRKGRPDWRPPREEEPRKGPSKAREGAAGRRALRVGFLTLPAPQERSPRPCAPGMAPRSLSCHAVGLPDPPAPPRAPGPRPGPLEGRGLEAPPAKRGGTPRGGCVRQTPPLKPSRSPQTRLSAGPPPPPPAPPPAEGGPGGEGEEPVYIEMVGDARRGGGGGAGGGGESRRGGGGGAPPPSPEEPEAIYEEMSCPLPAVEGGGHAPFPGHTPFLGHAPFLGPGPIPPPFPNLLAPRPPLLAAPPEGSRLPLPRRDLPPPARTRSHSTPLPPPAPGAGRERGGAGLGPLPLPPAPPTAAEAPPSGKRPPAYDSLRGGGAAGGPAPPLRDEEPLPRRGGGAAPRRGKEAEKAPEPPREERGGGPPPPSGIPVPAEGPRGRPGPPLPCQTFPACGRPTELPGGHRLGRSASTSGVRQAGAPPFPRGPPTPRPLSGGVPGAGGVGGGLPPPRPRDGQLQEVIDRKRCVCTEIKARGGRGVGLCKQDSLPPLPTPPLWRGGPPEGRPPPPPPPGTPPARRPHAVLWDTAI